MYFIITKCLKYYYYIYRLFWILISGNPATKQRTTQQQLLKTRSYPSTRSLSSRCFFSSGNNFSKHSRIFASFALTSHMHQHPYLSHAGHFYHSQPSKLPFSITQNTVNLSVNHNFYEGLDLVYMQMPQLNSQAGLNINVTFITQHLQSI